MSYTRQVIARAAFLVLFPAHLAAAYVEASTRWAIVHLHAWCFREPAIAAVTWPELREAREAWLSALLAPFADVHET